jgi:hypothetical protein
VKVLKHRRCLKLITTRHCLAVELSCGRSGETAKTRTSGDRGAGHAADVGGHESGWHGGSWHTAGMRAECVYVGSGAGRESVRAHGVEDLIKAAVYSSLRPREGFRDLVQVCTPSSICIMSPSKL